MKLIWCTKCKDLVLLREDILRSCVCGRIAGKYISQELTVINADAVLIGIDNNGFKLAEGIYKEFPSQDDVKVYFTGWIPLTPGHTRVVKTVKEVIEMGTTSTNSPGMSSVVRQGPLPKSKPKKGKKNARSKKY